MRLLARHHGREVHVLSLGHGEPATVLLTGLGVPAGWWHALGNDEEDVAGLLHSPPWNGRPYLGPLLAASGQVISDDRAGLGESGPLTAQVFTRADRRKESRLCDHGSSE